MTLKLKDRRKVTKTCVVQYDGEEVAVTYRPALMTSQTNDDAADASSKFNAEWVSRVVVEWDVIDEDGQKLPPTVENAAQLESMFLSAVMRSLYEDMRPNPRSGNGSFGG